MKIMNTGLSIFKTILAFSRIIDNCHIITNYHIIQTSILIIIIRVFSIRTNLILIKRSNTSSTSTVGRILIPSQYSFGYRKKLCIRNIQNPFRICNSSHITLLLYIYTHLGYDTVNVNSQRTVLSQFFSFIQCKVSIGSICCRN